LYELDGSVIDFDLKPVLYKKIHVDWGCTPSQSGEGVVVFMDNGDKESA